MMSHRMVNTGFHLNTLYNVQSAAKISLLLNNSQHWCMLWLGWRKCTGVRGQMRSLQGNVTLGHSWLHHKAVISSCLSVAPSAVHNACVCLVLCAPAGVLGLYVWLCVIGDCMHVYVKYCVCARALHIHIYRILDILIEFMIVNVVE